MTHPQARPGPFDGLPAFEPLADNLPPQMKSALVELRKALTDPPSLGDKFPFVMPASAKAKPGRPTTVQPNQVVRLARFVRLGDSLPVAAKKAGLGRTYAQTILAGQAPIAHHHAVVAAGVELPPMRPRRASHKTASNSIERRQAAIATPAGVDAPPAGALAEFERPTE